MEKSLYHRPKQQQHRNLDKLFFAGGNPGLTPQQRRQKNFASSYDQRNIGKVISRDCSLDKNEKSTRDRFFTLSGSDSIGSNQQRFSSLRTSGKSNSR